MVQPRRAWRPDTPIYNLSVKIYGFATSPYTGEAWEDTNSLFNNSRCNNAFDFFKGTACNCKIFLGFFADFHAKR